MNTQVLYAPNTKNWVQLSVQNKDIYSFEKRCLNENYHRNFGTNHRNLYFQKLPELTIFAKYEIFARTHEVALSDEIRYH